MNKVLIHFDGKTYEVEAGSAEHTALLGKIAAHDAEVKSKLDATKDLQSRLDTVTGERDVLKKKVDELQTKLDAAPAAAQAAARARLTLETDATKVLGAEFKFDSLSDRDVRVAVIQKFDPDFKADGKSDDYVSAVCDTYQKQGGTQVQERMILDQQGGNQGKDRKDSKEYVLDENDPDPDAARDKMRKDNREASRRPLSVSFQPAGK